MFGSMTVLMTVRGHPVPYRRGTAFPTLGTLFPTDWHAIPWGTLFPTNREGTAFRVLRGSFVLCRNGQQQPVTGRSSRPASVALDQAPVEPGQRLGNPASAELRYVLQLTKRGETAVASVVRPLRKREQYQALSRRQPTAAPGPVPCGATHLGPRSGGHRATAPGPTVELDGPQDACSADRRSPRAGSAG